MLTEFELTSIGSRAIDHMNSVTNFDDVIGNILDDVTSVEAQYAVPPFDELKLLGFNTLFFKFPHCSHEKYVFSFNVYMLQLSTIDS